MTDDRLAALRAAAEEAYVFTVPLAIMESFRRRRMALGPMNDMLHARKLLHHRSRAITAPNNDTLYSNAWIDLRTGPARITLPRTGDRYVSLALLDMWTDNFAVLGTRTTGPSGGTFTVIGPDASAEGIEGPVVRADTPVIWALARILVTGPEDLPEGHAIQDGLTLEAAPPPNAPAEDPDAQTRHAPWPEYFAHVSALMQVNRPRPTDLAVLERIAPLGLGPRFDAARFTAQEGEAIAEGVATAKAGLRSGLGGLRKRATGWMPPPPVLGNFGQDYRARARIAVGGLGALPLEEATYLSAAAFEDGPLDGRRMRRLRIPGDRPIPVRAFWSLSLYEPTEDGELYFIENPIARYAIGDRTPGLIRGPDGSLDIWIGHENPGPGRESNWLPAPAGPYVLILRAYHPEPELLDGRHPLPEPEPIDMEETTR